MKTLLSSKLPCCAVIVACVFSGCGSFQKIETADDLAQALKRSGVKFDSIEPLELPAIRYAKFDEGISLIGDGVRVEILRIEDPRTFKIMAATGPLLAALGERIEGDALSPPETYASRPFVVVIRAEPSEGETMKALSKLIPPTSE